MAPRYACTSRSIPTPCTSWSRKLPRRAPTCMSLQPTRFAPARAPPERNLQPVDRDAAQGRAERLRGLGWKSDATTREGVRLSFVGPTGTIMAVAHTAHAVFLAVSHLAPPQTTDIPIRI